MKCNLCKTREATNHHKDSHICDNCLLGIQLAFSYYIGGKEVTLQEFKRRTENT